MPVTYAAGSPASVNAGESLWAITTYFNPVGYRTRRDNFRIFREWLPIPLIAVEYSVDGFDLQPGDAEILVQLHGDDVMWQKERLYNIARGHLPANCEQVLWIDCDIVLSGPNWPERLKESLAERAVVQPFHRLALLVRDVLPPPRDATEVLDWRTSLVRFLEEDPGGITLFRQWGTSLRKKYSHGFAWAARRDVFDRFEFYDRMIVGGGDKAFTAPLFRQQDALAPSFAFDADQRADYLAWANAVSALVDGSVGYVDANAYHLWHGKLSDRGYDDRHVALHAAGFRALEDIRIDDATGCWRWATDKPALHEYVRGHFIRRREDG